MFLAGFKVLMKAEIENNDVTLLETKRVTMRYDKKKYTSKVYPRQ